MINTASLMPKITMQTTVLFLLLCSIGGAFSATVTYYTDNACKNVANSPLNGVSNPLILPFGVCTLAFNGGSQSYSKVTACSTTVISTSFVDSSCTVPSQAGVFTGSVGVCTTTPVPPGAQSFIISCSPAAKLYVGFFAVAAAVVAACL